MKNETSEQTFARLAITLFLITTFIISIKLYLDFKYITAKEKSYRKPCSCYTVISADSVEYCDGRRDTLTWQPMKRK